MSGGSFSLLYLARDLEELVKRRSDLADMAETLARLGYADDVARETQQLLALLDAWEAEAEARVKALRGVWKAVEWWHSDDWNEGHVHDALTGYRDQQRRASDLH
ncbi:hypothetical protein ABT160_02640 [Streptomyces sp. NPDC001941]|uniref:hypothetical protein n=1 Tax=Streptomyces sp. NPDC001941 TaxID=3154659 RepID=UPI003321A54F